MATVVQRHGNCSCPTWQLQFSDMATKSYTYMEEGPDHSNRGGTRGYCHAGRVARRRGGATAEMGRAGRVVARPDVLMRAIARAHRTCGLWRGAPGRARAGGPVSMPHGACDTYPLDATRVQLSGP